MAHEPAQERKGEMMDKEIPLRPFDELVGVRADERPISQCLDNPQFVAWLRKQGIDPDGWSTSSKVFSLIPLYKQWEADQN
jgi:hypothetical protein